MQKSVWETSRPTSELVLFFKRKLTDKLAWNNKSNLHWPTFSSEVLFQFQDNIPIANLVFFCVRNKQ